MASAPERRCSAARVTVTWGARCATLARLLAALVAVLLAACDPALPPLRGQLEVGREPYAILVGGSPGASDLYASGPGGQPLVPITFSPVAELAPALSPDGRAVAFLRAALVGDSTPGTVWVMSLGSGAEHEVRLPRGVGPPRRVGWSRNGDSVVVRAAGGLYHAAAGAGDRALPVPAAGRAAAESSLAVLLGDPVFARVVECEGATALCTTGVAGGSALLIREGRDPVRWGRDSVGFFRGSTLEVRPLGPGRPRALDWGGRVRAPRAVSYFSPPAGSLP